jgi:hypothetical protein
MGQEYKIINQVTTTDGSIVETSSDLISTSAITANFSGVTADSLTGNTIHGDGAGITNIDLNNTTGSLPLSAYTGGYIQNTIIVGKSGATNFTSVKAAIDSITDASISNRYGILVHPGIYVEDTITLKEFVDIEAYTSNSVIIEVNATSKNCVNVVGNVTLNGLIFRGSTDSGKTIFNISTDMGMGKVCTIIRCTAGNTYSILNSSLTAGTFGIVAFEGITGSYGNGFTTGFDIHGDGFMIVSMADSKNSVSNVMDDYIHISGANNKVILTNFGVLVQSVFGGALTNFIRCYSGATIEVVSVAVDGCGTGINNEDLGSGCSLKLNDVNLINTTMDLDIKSSDSTGNYFGTNDYVKTYINPLSSFYIVNKDLKVITVANKGGDFSSISTAVDYITGASETNIYQIRVGAGIFIEPLIDLSAKPYVSIVGASIQTTIVIPDSNVHNIFNVGTNNEISFLTIMSAGTGYVGIAAIDGGDFSQVHKVTFIDCDTCVKITSVSQDTVTYLEYVDFNGVMSYGLYIEATNGFNTTVNAENFYTFPTVSGFTSAYVTGIGSQLIINSAGIYGSESPNTISYGNTGIECQNGANIVMVANEVTGFNIGLLNNNTGSGCTISIAGTIFANNAIYDIDILSPFTTGGMIGSMDLDKLNINSLSTFTPFFTNRTTTGGAIVIGDLYQGANKAELVNLSKMVKAEAAMGVSTGGLLTEVSGLTIGVSAGDGYLYATGDFIKEVIWSATTLTIPSGTTKYISVDENAVVSANASKGDGVHNILLGSVYASTARIHYIENTPLSINLLGNRTTNFINEAFGVMYTTGSRVTENGTRQLNITSGERYYNLNEFISTGGTPVFFEEHWRNGDGTFRHGATTATTVQNNVYNPSSGLTAMTAGYYAKHSLYVTGEGDYEQYLLVYAQAQYSGLTEVVASNLPIPPTEFVDSTCIIASIITKEGATNIVQITDERPMASFNASNLSSTLIHGNLQGLIADDHQQYLLASGTRVMEGNLNLGTHNIISAGTINSVTIETHASRHLPNSGSDALTMGIPVDISNSSNADGIANSIARSDHRHFHGSISGGSTHSTVTTSIAGFMSAADKTYIDSVPSLLSNKANVSGQTFTGNITAPTISATTYSNLPTDIRVTGGTYNFGIITFTNNTGGTFTVTGLSTPFTGGTVTGATILTNGLTTNTISATTYSNLPIDIRVTGGTYSTGTATFTNNTGGTFTVTGFNTSTGSAFTGGTVTGATIFTNGLSTNTISATTYSNLPTDVRVTGGTYSSGTATFTNNTGGTFTVTGFNTSTGSAFTGGTVTGATIFTNGLTANTISATTYLNIPITPATFTGGTVNGATIFTNGLTANTITATTISASTIMSGTTNIGSLFLKTEAFSGLAKITVSNTAPSSPIIGDLWVDTN